MATKDFSSKQEKMIANFLDWKVVSGSGARDFNPGDIISEDWLGECKTHTTVIKDIVFYRNFWDKITSEAQSIGRYPALFVDDGSQKLSNTWVMFDTKLILPDDAKLVTVDIIRADVNIHFNNDDMIKIYDQLCRDNVRPVIIKVHMPDELGIMSLGAFYSAFF